MGKNIEFTVGQIPQYCLATVPVQPGEDIKNTQQYDDCGVSEIGEQATVSARVDLFLLGIQIDPHSIGFGIRHLPGTILTTYPISIGVILITVISFSCVFIYYFLDSTNYPLQNPHMILMDGIFPWIISFIALTNHHLVNNHLFKILIPGLLLGIFTVLIIFFDLIDPLQILTKGKWSQRKLFTQLKTWITNRHNKIE